MRTSFAVTLVVASCLCHVRPATAQEPLFVPASTSPVQVGKGSGEIFLADINRDGHVDLLTKHLLQNTISILTGDGAGRFTPISSNPLTLPYSPGTIALGDVNHDQILDLAIASRDASIEYLHVLLGNGKGEFTPVPQSPFKIGLTGRLYKPILRIVDLNEDGHPDLITSNGRRNEIKTRIGDGRAGFAAGPVTKLELSPVLHTFLLGDMDADGHLDLAVAGCTDGEVAAHFVAKRGDGKGEFAQAIAPPMSVPSGARLGALADLNGDQHSDVVLGHDTNRLSILMNDGKGVFQFASSLVVGPKMNAWDVVVGDFNRDKNADLIAATVHSETAPFESGIVVLLGDNRGFSPAPGSPFHAEPGSYRLTVGDVNEDGKTDIAASSFESTGVSVLLGR